SGISILIVDASTLRGEPHHRRVARTSRALVVRGILERSDEGVTSLQADRLEALDLSVPTRSRDFR
ncbi:hypothetical protein, partial [Cutibacterium avidum]|uniref:hypothetical protein n=1 Tax=Cutibacterium avidum TaxID=33010 RepID=UPI003B00A932